MGRGISTSYLPKSEYVHESPTFKALLHTKPYLEKTLQITSCLPTIVYTHSHSFSETATDTIMFTKTPITSAAAAEFAAKHNLDLDELELFLSGQSRNVTPDAAAAPIDQD